MQYPATHRRTRIALFLTLFATFATFCSNAAPVAAAAEPEEENTISPGDVVVVPLDGPVSKAQFVFLRRILKDAESAKASAFIINMDTPGGELGVTEDITQLLTKSTIPTYTWVNTHAASAGALIALATKHIYMAPISAIGAAAPVMGTGEDIPETMLAKTVSFNTAYYRGIAEQNGHNPKFVDAFMDQTAEFKIGDEIISPKDSLLTLNATEATKEYDGRPLLAAGTASTLDELKEKAGLQGPTAEIQPSGFETIAQWITLAAPLFLLGGIIGAYMEFKTPGFGVAGFIAAVCFLIFFTGHYIAGLTGMEVIAVFVLGLLLILFELIFFPGLFIPSALGVLLVLGSLLFAMVDKFPGEPVLPNIEMLALPMINLGIALVLAVVVITFLARFLPDLPIFRRVILATASPVGPSLAVEPDSAFDTTLRLGDTGITRSSLRPAGKAQIGPAFVDVVSDGEFIDPGTPIKVIEIAGSRVVVSTAR